MDTPSTNQVFTPTIPKLELLPKTSAPSCLTLISSPGSFCAKLTIRSIADNFLNDSWPLSKISREFENGPFVVKALLVYLISDVALFVEVGKNMGGEQVKQTADLIMEDYSHLKPEDYILCFKRAKKGHYGPLYDRLDGQIIMEWLAKYDLERDGEIEIVQAKYNKLLKEAGKQTLLPVSTDGQPKDALFIENMAKLLQRLQDNKKARDALKETKAINQKDPIQDIFQTWIKQFDNLRYKQRDQGNRCGFIRRYGLIINVRYQPGKPVYGPKMILKMLDLNEYLNHKQWQYDIAQLPKEERIKYYLIKYPKK